MGFLEPVSYRQVPAIFCSLTVSGGIGNADELPRRLKGYVAVVKPCGLASTGESESSKLQGDFTRSILLELTSMDYVSANPCLTVSFSSRRSYDNRRRL